jgi:hypothetical protein
MTSPSDQRTADPKAGFAPCGGCGMLCTATEYHPYAACLMFKACNDPKTVRDNLQAVLAHGYLRGTMAQ